MAIVFATNDISDFVGAGISTDSTDRRTAYVSQAFITSANSVGQAGLIAFTRIPTVAGNITWIHFQYAKSRDFTGGGSDGFAVLELFSGSGVKILDFDMSNGVIRLRLFGSSTLTANITGNMIGQNAPMAVDIKIDLTSDISVEMFVNGVSKYNQSQAWSSSPGNPAGIYWRIADASDFGAILQYTSELIVADESTIGMGLSKMVPNAAGNYSQWQGDHAATGDSDVGTGVSTDAISQKLSSGLSSIIGPASSALRALVVNTKASTRGGTVNDLRTYLRISSTDYNGAAMGVDGDIKSHITVWDTNPDSAADWDTTDFSGVEVGVESLI